MMEGNIRGTLFDLLPLCDRLENVRLVEVKGSTVTVFLGNRNLGKIVFTLLDQDAQTEIEYAVQLGRFLIWKAFGVENPQDRPDYYVCYCGQVFNGDQACNRCRKASPSERGSPDWVVSSNIPGGDTKSGWQH